MGWLTRTNIYFHYLEKYFLYESIQRLFNLILQQEALVMTMLPIVTIITSLWLAAVLPF